MPMSIVVALLLAQAESNSGTRITPPTVASVAPLGVARGTTVELTVEGFNLAKASAIYFSEPGIKGKIVRVKELPDLPDIRLGANGTPSTIDLGPLPPRNQVTVELDIDPEAAVGPVNFRIQTPLGTSPAGMINVEPYFGEAADREPNDTPETAFETYLPAVLAGTISKPGDLDFYQIKVKAGEELVFDNGAMELGSALQPLVAIVTADGTVVKEYGYDGGRTVTSFAHKFAAAGTYYVRVSDYQRGGSGRHFYRIKVGQFPVVSGVYPLGMAKGAARKVSVRGYALGLTDVAVEGKAAPEDEDAVIVRAQTPNGFAHNKVKLALGRDPEVEAGQQPGQMLKWPVTVNGWLDREQTFKIQAAKGQKVVLEVNARRLGSDVDSVIEVLDAQGKAIERATVRPVWERITALRDHDSVSRGIRIQSWNALKVGDYVQAGGEIIRVEAIPKTPDDDCIFESFGGQRITYFGTTPEAHANDRAVYKVQIHPPGAKFTANGLPLTRLYYRNDDGGPGYSKDSYLEFVAPADGEYLVRLADSRNEYGKRGGPKDYAYRLNIREPRPDFRLAINPRNPNVPRGGSVPLTVTAFRTDGFEGPIEVELLDLPAGLKATRGVIGAGQVNATILLMAEAEAKLEGATPLKAIGRAKVNNRDLAHYASPDDKLKLISLMPPADVAMTAMTRVVEVEPGGTADVEVMIKRQNGFGGRVPVQIMNLPPRVRVLDVGLNGVLINENETKRSFTIEALASAEPIEQIIYVGGQTETRSPLQSVYTAPETILLRVKAPKPVANRSF